MKAFLSHTKRDGHFVRQVFERLGPASAEFDEVSFEKAVLNVEAISSALQRCDLFVLFASSASLASNFVSAESKLAIERWAAGHLRRIYIVCLDDDSFSAIPDFLKQMNMVRRQPDPIACYRSISNMLQMLDRDYHGSRSIFVGRGEEQGALMTALATPSDVLPLGISISGLYGIGRRTLVRKVFAQAIPAIPMACPQVEVVGTDSIVDVYDKIRKEFGVTSFAALGDEISAFAAADYPQQISELKSLLSRFYEGGEILYLVDRGGLLTDDGSVQDYIRDTVAGFSRVNRPVVVLIQQRMTPARLRPLHARHIFVPLSPLGKDDTRTLLGRELHNRHIHYTSEQLEHLCKLVDGHPLNIEYAVRQIELVGLETFLLSPSDLVVWKNKRGDDYISILQFDDADRSIIGLLIAYHYFSIMELPTVLGRSREAVGESLKKLIEFHCLEQSNGLVQITPPLVDAFARDRKFALSHSNASRISKKLIDMLDKYVGEDYVPVGIVGPAIISKVRSGSKIDRRLAGAFLRPSHYLFVARTAYDGGAHLECANLCEEALRFGRELTAEAIVEACRLAGLSYARLNRTEEFGSVIHRLEKVKGRGAAVLKEFLLGFGRRLAGDLVAAERHYLNCDAKKSNNFYVARELAFIYLSLGRDEEALTYARDSYRQAPTNPYQIDALVAVLIRTTSRAPDLRTNEELARLFEELQTYGHKQGRSFYPMRKAEFHGRLGELKKAEKWADDAVNQTDRLFWPRKIRAEILIKGGALTQAKKDIEILERIVDDSNTGEGKSYLVQLLQLKMKYFIGMRQYRFAYEHLQNIKTRIPLRLWNTLAVDLAYEVASAQGFYETEVSDWANRTLAKR